MAPHMWCSRRFLLRVEVRSRGCSASAAASEAGSAADRFLPLASTSSSGVRWRRDWNRDSSSEDDVASDDPVIH